MKPCLHELASRTSQHRSPLWTVKPLGDSQFAFHSLEVSPAPKCESVHFDTDAFPFQRLERIAPVRTGFAFAGMEAGALGPVGRLGFRIGPEGTSCRAVVSSSSADETQVRRNFSNDPTPPPPAFAYAMTQDALAPAYLEPNARRSASSIAWRAESTSR